MTNEHAIARYRITRFELPVPRTIGDWRVRIERHELAALELQTRSGLTGLGFFGPVPYPGSLAPLPELERRFAVELADGLLGQQASSLLHRIPPSRTTSPGRHPFATGVDTALWDLAAKELDLPLFRLLGAVEPRVPAYASGLDFPLSEDERRTFFAEARALGFSHFKVKVGAPDLATDVERLRTVHDVVGDDAVLSADANEAWTAKEALRRLHAFRADGHDLFWIEDPCRRDDLEGTALVRALAPWVQVNVGEFLDAREQRRFLEHGACDILNLRVPISDAQRAAELAREFAIRTTLGNSILELGAHLAAALPEFTHLEYSFLGLDALVEEPFAVADGFLHLPERPGHGLTVSAEARDVFGMTGAWRP